MYTATTPGTFPRTLDIDAAETGVCVVATQERHVQHSRQQDVVDEQRATGEQSGIFIPEYACADETCHA